MGVQKKSNKKQKKGKFAFYVATRGLSHNDEWEGEGQTLRGEKAGPTILDRSGNQCATNGCGWGGTDTGEKAKKEDEFYGYWHGVHFYGGAVGVERRTNQI